MNELKDKEVKDQSPESIINQMLTYLESDELSDSALQESLERDLRTLAHVKQIPVEILYNLRRQSGYRGFSMILKMNMLDDQIAEELEVSKKRLAFRMKKARTEMIANEISPRRSFRGF